MLRQLLSSFVVRIIAGAVLAVVMVGVMVWYMLTPVILDEAASITVEEGETLSDVAYALKEEHVIRSATLFQSVVLFKGGETDIVAGEYRFYEPESAFKIADRLLAGEYGIDLHTVVIPEGVTAQEVATLLRDRITGFDKEAFAAQADEYEGFLFPATYTFPSDVTPDEVLQKMRDTFDERIDQLERFEEDEQDLEEVVTLASIIEREAGTIDSKRIISGILHKRLEEEMPLQVDAAFLYMDSLAHKTSATLTMNDLTSDSPYNTYTRVGLPPTPISNPGMNSIKAAIDPIESDYYFYLNDRRGNMYYATDYQTHLENRKYLGI